MDCDKVYFQKEKDGSVLVETSEEWGVYCSDIPFTIATKAKELTSRDWYDEDGLDEYVPEELKMSAYDIEVDFICKGDRSTSIDKISNMINYLTGRDGSGVLMKAYCSLTGIGRQHVRFKELKDDAQLIHDTEEILTFTIVLQVGDPVTEVRPEYDAEGKITKLN